MEDWRERLKILSKQFGYWYADGKEFVVCPVCGIDVEKLEDFIEREIGKARKEGYELACKYIRDEVLEDRKTCRKLGVEGKDVLDIIGSVWSYKDKLN